MRRYIMNGMEILLGYMFLFMLGCLLGWIIEVFYRRIFSAKKWLNPGFLNGPWLPLYGFGVSIMYAICDLPIDFWWKILIIAAAMTVIEYIAGIIFIKGMHIKLWDYSDEWANLQGIICPKYSLFWTALGAAFLFLLYPPLSVAFGFVGSHPYLSLPIGILYGVFITDVGLSFNLAAKIRAAAASAKQIIHYEKFKAFIADANTKRFKHRSFLFPFKSRISVREHVSEFIETLKSRSRDRSERMPTDPNIDAPAVSSDDISEKQ